MKMTAVFFLAVILCGCTPLLIGAGVGAVAGYCVTKDAIQGELDVDFNTLYNAAKSALEEMGEVTQQDTQSGRIDGVIGLNKVKISVDSLTKHTQRLKVKCRKGFLPNLTLANRIFVKIINKVK